MYITYVNFFYEICVVSINRIFINVLKRYFYFPHVSACDYVCVCVCNKYCVFLNNNNHNGKSSGYGATTKKNALDILYWSLLYSNSYCVSVCPYLHKKHCNLLEKYWLKCGNDWAHMFCSCKPIYFFCNIPNKHKSQRSYYWNGSVKAPIYNNIFVRWVTRVHTFG